MMNRRDFILRSAAFAGALCVGHLTNCDNMLKAWASGEFPACGYYRIVVLGDPHMPVRKQIFTKIADQKRLVAAKESLLADINSWTDVSQVSVLGDLAADLGNLTEYKYSHKFFNDMKWPVHIINGNHDYVYKDKPGPDGKHRHIDVPGRRRKLEQFKKVWNLSSLWYTKQAGPFFLIYMGPDGLTGTSLSEISDEQLAWFESQLASHKDEPTLVFFHAPLAHTLRSYNKIVNTPRFVTQPVDRVDKILKANSQVLLWVSGHTHTPATESSFADKKINTYTGRLTDIHNSDLDRKTALWSNSLYLYPDKIQVRTFDHKAGTWLTKLDRTFTVE